MFKKLFSLTIVATLFLANGLVGMEQASANLWNYLQNATYPLHTIAAKAENDCTWPIEVGDETVRVPVDGMVTALLEQGKDINELMQPDTNHKLKLTPLDIAEERGNHALASLLKSKCAENSTILLWGQPDNPEEEFYEQLEVPLYIARKCDYFNNHILDFAEGQNGFPQELTLGQVVFEEDLYHNTLEQLFDFLEHENIDALSNLSDTQLKRLTEAADYLLINKNGQGFLNKLDNNNKTVLDITILNNNQALADALKAFGAKETHLVNDCNNFQEVLLHLKLTPHTKEKLICINLSNKNIQSISANDILELTKYTVVYLNLENNQLTDLPTEMNKLKKLTTLNLGHNQLTDLPIEITNLENLTDLNLWGNQLTQEALKIIATIHNLTDLDLICNQLTKLPTEIGNLANLTTLNLNCNQLTELPTEIGNWANLTTLKLYGNQLTQEPLKIIATIPNLTTLDLERNQLTDLPTEIANLTTLTKLYLGLNQLTHEALKIITTIPNLTNLNLKCNQLTELPTEIGNLANLTTLKLYGNPLTQGTLVIVEQLRNRNITVKT